ncbi:MAG: branched-chain amino acid ABC transporter permease [Candidatus Ornithospirochaeta sp.]|nr:branched-chain amino acid ABC transporter permease [Sphaerochaetaceae bacterium]MDY5524438.1 branched-chain amino acid ABC transporter permease [Candidatus Ornithospirochaeta sp.]
MRLFLYVLTQVCITLVSVCGIYILTGLTGMFSLGSAAFMAIGAYVSGLLVLKLGMNMYLAFLLAIIAAVAVGYVIGFPVVRLRRDYISLVTLGFGESIAQLILLLSQYTGGAFGLIGVPRKVNVGFTVIAAALAIALTALFKTSKYGRQCIAIKSDELAAKAMGINTSRVKMIAFLLSCGLTAFAGCMYAFYVGYVGPTDFGWKKSADWVIMVFFGGVNSLTGSIFGGAFLTFLPQYMQSLNKYRYIVYAVLVLFILNFKPNGIFGEWELTPRNMKKALKKFDRKMRKEGGK